MPSDISTGLTSAAMTRSEFGEQDSSESYFENNAESVIARVVNLRVDKQFFTGSILIYGNPIFGIWGSFNWGNNNNNNSFIVGNNLFGILGNNTLGTEISPPVRYMERFMWHDYNEQFSDTVYEGVGTTAVGWGTGSVVFGVGSVLQTKNIGSDVQLFTTKYTSAKVSLYGSYTYQSVGSVSSDNGSTWTPLATYGAEQSITSVVGSEPVIRVYDPTGSVVITMIDAYFHTNDVI